MKEPVRYQLKSADKWRKDPQYDDGRMTWMSPSAFLSRVPPLLDTQTDKQTIEKHQKRLEDGKKLKPLAIYANGKPNGRHRATAAEALGIKKVPVLVGGKEPPKYNGKLAVKRGK